MSSYYRRGYRIQHENQVGYGVSSDVGSPIADSVAPGQAEAEAAAAAEETPEHLNTAEKEETCSKSNELSFFYILVVVIASLVLLYLLYIAVDNVLYGGRGQSYTSFGESEYNLASAFDIAK